MLQYFITPMVGAVIGYFTNDLAIRMLFRPHQPKYLFGHKIPFTPGLIAKERGRIAASLGQAISANLMNPEVLQSTLLSPEMLQKVEGTIDQRLYALMQEERSLREWLQDFLSAEDLAKIEAQATKQLAVLVTDKLVNAGLGERIAQIAVSHALNKMTGGLMGMLGGDKLLRLLQVPAEELLRKNIDEMLGQHAPEMAQEMVGQGVEEFMKQPVAQLLEDKQEQLQAIRHSLLRLYRNTIEQQLPQMLATLNIAQIIESRINEMDVAEVEQLILGVMKRELRAIVWIGGGLGLIIGLVNCLFL